MVNTADLNPFGTLGIGSIGVALLTFFFAIVFVFFIGAGIFYWIQKKQLKYTIPLHKMIGNRVIRIATYKAKDFPIGFAGDKLWYIPKLKKYIPAGTLQTAPSEYTHFEREDGEWINIDYPDIDEKMKQAKVKYVHSDMRSQRIAISNVIEQRFKGKESFWEKYGNLITYVIFYMVVAICMVIIFWQWSDIITKTNTLLQKIIVIQELNTPKTQGVIPAISLFMMRFNKKWI